MTKFEKIKATINKMYPEVKIRQKKDIWLFRLLKKTTGPSFSIGKNIILGRQDPDILVHELQHWFDRKNEGSLHWYYDYLSPQIYSAFWVLAGILAASFGVWAISGVCLVATIICLLPVESEYRVELERRAYLAGMWTSYQMHPSEVNLLNYADYVSRSMSSKLYYGMIEKDRAEILAKTMTERVRNNDTYGIMEAVNVVLLSEVSDELTTIQ